MLGESLGPYRIESELGSGGMGTVYLATTTRRAAGLDAGTSVALKVVHSHLLETEGFFKRFLFEAQVGKTVQQENLVRTLDADALMCGGKQLNFLVMEYVEGQTLRDLLKELGKVPEELCRHIGREICRALAAIHAAGIVHRDLKPDNALITKDECVKVMDLGVARLADEVIRLSQTGAFVGSVLYAAPEQFMGSDDIDGRVDLYALGLTLYELTTGEHPFMDEDLRVAMRRQLQEEARPVAELNPQLSPFFEEVVKTLLAKDKEKRFESAELVLGILTEGEESEWWRERVKHIRAETHQPLRRIRIPRETALYGRDDELAKLHQIFDRAHAGEGQALLLLGEAGIGKTRLVDEFIGRLRQEGADVNFLFGGYPPGGAATASGAFSTAYREQLGTEDLEKTLRAYLQETPLLVPAFAALLTGDATPTGTEPLTKDSIQTVFVHATRALARERTTIVLIDDLHYAPLEGRALFAAIAAAVSSSRVLLLGTARDELPDGWTAGLERQQHFTTLALDRLRPKDVGDLLLDIFRSRRLADELGFQVLTKSDGNPFFVFEIVRGLREGKFIARSEDGKWMKTGVIGDIQIPSSVLDLIEGRIQDLAEEEKDLLEVAACAGYEFDPSLVADALGLGVLPALKQFARIEKTHRLIRSAGRSYVFDHHQVQEALYKGVFEQIREHYHAALGDALEARAGVAESDPKDVDGPLAQTLCRHFLSARRGEQALRYLKRALSHLASGYLHESAVALADQALGVSGLLTGVARLDALLARASGLSSLGRRVDQRETLETAMALAEEMADDRSLLRVHSDLREYAYSTGEFETSIAEGRRVLELAERIGDRDAEQVVLGRIGMALWSVGRFDEACDYLERAIAIAQELGSDLAESNASMSLGVVLWDLGFTGRTRALFERSIDLAHARSTMACVNLGELYGVLGRLDQAEELLEHGRNQAQETGHRWPESMALHELGDITERQGDLDRARRLYEESCALSEDIRNRYDQAECLVLLGRVLISISEDDEAKRRCEQALELSRAIGRRDTEALALVFLAGLGGDVSVAEDFCAAHEEQIGKFEQVELHHLLWKATGTVEHLGKAYRRLMFLRDNASQDCRESIIENVPLHAEVVAAWAEHGEATDAG